MILILGSHHDDVLYCSSLLSQAKKETVLGRFPAQKGMIFNQEVMTVSGIHTSLLASMVVSHILSTQYVNLVFVLGKCFSLNNSFKQGTIVVGREIMDIDVDQIDVANTKVGQVPGMPEAYKVQSDLIGYLTDGFHRRTLANPEFATMLSSDNLYSPAVTKAIENRSYLGSTGPFAVDSCSYGATLACSLLDVPCMVIKAVERDLSQDKSIDGYLTALDSYVDIGKAVVYTIGDIGRSDVLRLRRTI